MAIVNTLQKAAVVTAHVNRGHEVITVYIHDKERLLQIKKGQARHEWHEVKTVDTR